MANFSQTFTGKGTSEPLRDNGTQAQQGLNEMVLNAEKIRYQVYEKNRSEFLRSANIDPEFVLSDSARKTQMLQIEEFNKKWGKRAQETNYNLSQQDLLDMQTHKNLIISTQQDQLAKYELFKQHRAAVAQNPNRFDADKFNEAQDAYMQSGNYDLVMPPLKPIPPGSYIRSLAQKIEGVNPRQVIAGNQRGIETTPFATQEEAENFVQESLLQNDQVMIGGLEEWSTLPQTEKDKWFTQADENNDSKYSESEQQNAIMMWMKKRYASEAMRETVKNWKNIPQGKSSTTTEPSDVGGAPTKIYPGKQTPNQQKMYGDQEYSKTQSFSFGGNAVINGIPTRGGKAITANWDAEEIAKGSINGRLVLYDPTKKIFLVESTTASESADQKSRTLIEVPEENILDFGNIPIEYIGNKMTIAEYKKFMAEPAPTSNSKVTAPAPVAKKKLY